jgi:predicted dehydrogenase
MARYIYWIHRDGLRPGGNRYPLWMDHPMLLEQTIHHLDLFRYTYGSEVKWIWCKSHNPSWSRYENDATALAVLELENGLLINYCGTWMGQSRVNEFQWRTDFSEGAILQTDIYSELFMAKAGEQTWQRVEVPPDAAYIDDTRQLLKGVIDALADGRPPQPSAGDNLRTLALVFACIESSATGERIEMEAYYHRYGLTPRELAV